MRKMNLQAQHKATSSHRHTIIAQLVIRGVTLALSLTADLDSNISVTIRRLRGSTYLRHIDATMRAETLKEITKEELKNEMGSRMGRLLQVEGELMERVQVGRAQLRQLEGKKLTEFCHAILVDSIKKLLRFSGGEGERPVE